MRRQDLYAIAILAVGLSMIAGWMFLPPPAHAQPALQDDIPTIPHPIDELTDCVACHGSGVSYIPQMPESHSGSDFFECQDCHVPNPIPAPRVPHAIAGRESCLDCHELGMSDAPIVPEDHAGRENGTCFACHRPTLDIPTIPHETEGRENCLLCHVHEDEAIADVDDLFFPETPVAPEAIDHPELRVPISGCESCHASLEGDLQEAALQWRESIHAERGVNCADCHGGNPNIQDDRLSAKSPIYDYVGVPDRTEIPNLCGSCHADVNLMRQYDIPTDQLAKYRESFHGQQLAEGDTNVATCWDCHDEHATRQSNDPTASVYPINVPGLCASCHADTGFMAPYDIPTNQYELFEDSVHGIALLEHANTRAPSCATCHGTHGAAPPGYQQVENVCGSCHTATLDYYLESAHNNTNSTEAPQCVTCHGRYDVGPATIAQFEGTDDRHCGSCHAPGSETAQTVQEIHQMLSNADESIVEAEALVQRVARLGMIVTEEESLLAEARTKLITAQAAQHTVNVELIQEHTDASIEVSDQVMQLAREDLGANRFRRMMMMIVVAVILVNVFVLTRIRRGVIERDEME